MTVEFTPQAAEHVAADWLLIVTTSEAGAADRLGMTDPGLRSVLDGLLRRKDFTGKEREVVSLYQRPEPAAENVMVCGCGTTEALSAGIVRLSLMSAFRQISVREEQRVAVWLDPVLFQQLSVEQLMSTVADAVVTGPLDAGLYRREKKHFPLAAVTVCGLQHSALLSRAVQSGLNTGQAVNLTRNLVNECPSDLYPESFADRVLQQASAAGLSCRVLNEMDLRRERMGAMLAVAQGSDRPPRLVQLEYRGAAADQPVVALVGKGVTFDSGGYSIKTTEGMLSMKADMAGAATVISVGLAAAAMRLPVNLNVYAGLVENLISGNAYKLGDVLTTRNGLTVEVHNTDAEGRLVLADVLSYAVDDGVAAIVDVATLTGACVVALGEDIAGLFGNNQLLADRLQTAAGRTGERLWQMPMDAQFDEQLKSDVADLKNVGSRWGGAITAAKFLQRFVGDVPWAHLDIAGPSFASSAASWRDAGATGCMVRSLIAWLAAAGEQAE